MQIIIFYVEFEIYQSWEAILLLMNAVYFFEFTNCPPGTRLRPGEHYNLMLLSHKLRHQVVNGNANDFTGRKSKHILNILTSSGDDAHWFSIYECLDNTAALVIYKLFKLLDWVKLFLFVSVVNLFNVFAYFPSVVEKAHLYKVEQQ